MPKVSLDIDGQKVGINIMHTHVNGNNQVEKNLSTSDVFEFENYLKELNHKELKLLVKKLNYLCLNFDPYNTDTLTTESENIIRELGVENLIDNPFAFTNKILQLLDKTENFIKEREH